MIPIAKPIIEKKEIDQVIKVLQSGLLVQGEEVYKLEEKFKKLCQTKYAIATNSGTSALHTALYSIGIKPGDEVITTPFSFIASTNSILMMGAKPVFVDIDPYNFNIDATKIEKAITKKTKALLVVNVYGYPANYTQINKIARKYNLVVVEDAAQSINATYHGRKSGNLADIACFSLYATKNIISGEGGMITTNKKVYVERARQFRNHGQSPKMKYNYLSLGYNYRMSNLHAAIALAQFTRVSFVTEKRKEIAKIYSSGLKSLSGIQLPTIEKNVESVFHQYTIRVTKKFKLSRKQLKELLQKKGIQTEIYYPKPLYSYPHVRSIVGKIDNMPHVSLAAQEVLSLPIYPSLKKEEINYIINTIKNI